MAILSIIFNKMTIKGKDISLSLFSFVNKCKLYTCQKKSFKELP